MKATKSKLIKIALPLFSLITLSTALTISVDAHNALEQLKNNQQKISKQTNQPIQADSLVYTKNQTAVTGTVTQTTAQTIQHQSIIVQPNDVIIDGKTYSKSAMDALINEAQVVTKDGVQATFAAVAAAPLLLIPGVGEAAMTAAGVITVAGVSIAAGTWLYNNIHARMMAAKSSTTTKQGPIGKPNRKKQGREPNTKARQKEGWQGNPNKKTDRPMKKHTPAKEHRK